MYYNVYNIYIKCAICITHKLACALAITQCYQLHRKRLPYFTCWR